MCQDVAVQLTLLELILVAACGVVIAAHLIGEAVRKVRRDG
jgi:cell division protein FtsL